MRLEQYYFLQGATFALGLASSDDLAEIIKKEAEQRWPEFDPPPTKESKNAQPEY